MKRTEELDSGIPRIVALKPDVLIVTGDHSTPAKMKSHSGHAVPTLLVAENCRFDGSKSFGESACRVGELGMFEAKYLMLYALSHAAVSKNTAPERRLAAHTRSTGSLPVMRKTTRRRAAHAT